MPKLLKILMCLIIPIHGMAQADKEDKEIANQQKLESSNSASGSSNFLSAFSFTQLAATNDGTNAEANIRLRLKGGYVLAANVSTPVSNNTEQVRPLTITGLSNNSSASVGLQKIVWGLGFKPNYKERDAVVEKLVKEGKIADKDNWNYEDLDSASKILIDKSVHWGTALFFGANFKFDQESFTYITDTNSYSVKDASKTGVNISGTVGVLFTKGDNLSVSYSYQSSYSAPSALEYSFPVKNGISLQKKVSPTPPELKKDSKLKFEYVTTPLIKGMCMLDPNVTVLIKEKIFSCELPIYFLSNAGKDGKKAGFNGGVYVGYISDANWKFNFTKDNFGLGVFIGANIKDLFHKS